MLRHSVFLKIESKRFHLMKILNIFRSFLFFFFFLFCSVGIFRIIGSCSSEILCTRFFSGRCCFFVICKKRKTFTFGCLLCPRGLGFSLLGVFNFQDWGQCGARVIAGCGCVGFPVLLCCPWGCAWGKTATHPDVMLLDSQI